MPINALIFEAEELEFKARSSGSVSPTGTHAASLITLYTPDAISVAVGIELYATSRKDDTDGDSWQVSYNGPCAPFGGINDGGATFRGDVSIGVILKDYKLYVTQYAKFRVVFSGVDVYVNDSFHISLGPAVDVTSDALGPSWVPIFCGLVSMGGGAGSELPSFPPYVPGTPYEQHPSATATVSGGWRFKKDGVWHSPPVAVPPASTVAPMCGPAFGPPSPPYPPPPTICGPFGLQFADSVVSSSTWGTHLHMRADESLDVWASGFGAFDRTEKYDRQGGTIMLVPNLPKGLNRLNPDDFGASLFRWAVPMVRGQSARHVALNDGFTSNAGTFNSVAPVTVYDGPASVEVGNTNPAKLDILSLPSYSIVTLAHSKYSNHTTLSGSTGTQDLKQEDLSYSFPTNMTGPSSPVAPYMQHAELEPNYFNSILCHPWWHFGHTPGDWDLVAPGASVDWAVYWGPIREPYLAAQQRRAHNVSCPLEYSAHTPFLDAFDSIGNSSGLRWVGVCRWKTQTVTPPASIALTAASAPAWTAEDDGATFAFDGTGVTITPAAETILINLDVGNFFLPPYQYPAICDRIRLDWITDNVAELKVYAVGVGGKRELIADTPSLIPRRLPAVRDERYGGTWGSDNGLGEADDGGTDLFTFGQSAAIMANSERVTSLGFLIGRSVVSLQFELTVEDVAETVKIKYPVWIRSEGPKRQFWESGQCVATLYKDGPGARLGNHIWFDPVLGLLIPPAVTGLGYKNTIIDWLLDRRVLLEGVDPVTGGTPNLTTELTQLFDTFEGQSIAQVDKNSLSFLLPQNNAIANSWSAALVNTVGEIPPLGGFPHFGRNVVTWEETSSLSNAVWVESHLDKPLIVAGGEMSHLHRPSGLRVTSPVTSLSGWSVSTHKTLVDNFESPNWTIRRGDKEWAKVTPWHGYMWAGGEAVAKATSGVHQTRDTKTGFRYIAVSDENGVKVVRFRKGVELERETVALEAENVTGAQIAVGAGGVVVLAWSDGESIRIRRSTSQGIKWEDESAMPIGAGSWPALATDKKTGIEYCAGWTGSPSSPDASAPWVLYRKRSKTAEWEDLGEIASGPMSSAGLEVGGEKGNLLVFAYADDGLKRRVSSSSGSTWEDM
ncbi:hypothetical protein EON81_17715 [bacterium]|nr:MAG: hypothetical protein EON81_17715 [bacterium]